MASWPPPQDGEAIELWVERIPYPETRYYTKKVLDNLLSYTDPSGWTCNRDEIRLGQSMPQKDTPEQQGAEQQH